MSLTEERLKTGILTLKPKTTDVFSRMRQTFLFISGITVIHMHVHVYWITGSSSYTVCVGGLLAGANFHFPFFFLFSSLGPTSSSAALQAVFLSNGCKILNRRRA